jgi:hypothetical protein
MDHLGWFEKLLALISAVLHACLCISLSTAAEN